MPSERLTITLPENLARRLREESQKSSRPVSQLVAEALEEHERAQLKERLIEAYKAIANDPETLEITEAFWTIAGETLPDE